MFKQCIADTPFVTDAANSYFDDKIIGQAYKRDLTFLSTMRALVTPRLASDNRVYVQFTESRYSYTDVRENPTHLVMNAICNVIMAVNEDSEGILTVHNFANTTQESNYACLELMKSSFESMHSGWHIMPKVTDFFRKVFYVLCFVHPEKKNVVLFVDNMDMRKMHYLQCGIFAYFPWYFDPEAGVSELEMELIQSLREKTPNKYEDCLARMVGQYDFRTIKVKQLLRGFETRYERLKCQDTQNRIAQELSKIQSLNDRIEVALRAKHDLEIELLGLEAKIAGSNGENSEIMDYFLCNKKLSLEFVDDREMIFSCWGYVEYFDEDMAEKLISNKNSYFYKPNGIPCGRFIDASDAEMLMRAIFIDQTIRVKFCAAYDFSLQGSVRGVRDHNFGYEFRDCTPNVHIDKFQCMGNYQYTINNMLLEHNYIGAIEQCVASCKSLNLGDSVVMKAFVNRLYGISTSAGDRTVNIRCIELPDGTIATPKEAIKWLKEQKGE